MIFAVGFALRVVVILVGHTYRIRTSQGDFDFGFEAGRIARSLATGHGYGNPFNGVSGPTAWLPPLYPLLMAAAFKVFGVYTRGAALALMVVDSAFSAAIAPAVYEIAARCFDARGIAAERRRRLPRRWRVWSAWMWAVYPAALQYAVHWIWEMSVTACLFAWAIVVVLRMRREKQGLGRCREAGIRVVVCVGGVVGVDCAVECFAAALLAGDDGLGGLAGVAESGGWVVRTVVGAVLTCVAFAAVLAPWVVRNERVMGAPVLTRDNFGVELYESTLERNDGFPWGTTVPLWTGDPEYKQYVRMGEIAFVKMRGDEAKARIRGSAGRTAKWTLDRFLFFWDGTPHPANGHLANEYLRQLSYCFLSVCGLLGLGLMLRRRVEGAGLFAVIFVLLPLPYYLVTVQPRFRHPMEPLIAVLAVFLFRSAEKIGIRD